ncbi:MAG: efflux transporter, outer rane factor lipoprotein NodT family [Caulobacteraceae bacterium]|nr:efflux transporter, outer rane factor lipoprotein NodT family [Caulobacteraceae bacterium]
MTRPRLEPLMAALTSLIACGCAAVGPNFRPPSAPATSRYVSPADTAEAAASAEVTGSAGLRQSVVLGERVTAQWWTLFRSPQLDGVVRQAIAGSPTLDAAKARLAQAREAVAETRATLFPQVGLSATDAEEKQSAAAFGLSPQTFPLPSRYNIFQVGPTASYNLDLFGGVRRQVEERSAQADEQADQLDAAYMALTGNAVTQAIRIAAFRAQLAAVDEILAADRQNAALVGEERRVGEAPDPDVVIARSQVAADETLRPGLAQQLSIARHTLAVLVGQPPGDWSPPDFDLATLTLPGQVPVSLPSELVHQRPDILAAEARLHAASAQIGVAAAQLYPSITLTAGADASSLNGGALFSQNGLVWSIAAGVAQPVFDAGRRRAERRAALAAFRATAADYRQTVLEAFGQVANLLQALGHDADLVAGQRRSWELAASSVRLQRINYGRGGIGMLPVLDAERQYARARLGYLQAQAQRYQDTAELLVAMGGGWWGADLTRADNTTSSTGRRP